MEGNEKLGEEGNWEMGQWMIGGSKQRIISNTMGTSAYLYHY